LAAGGTACFIMASVKLKANFYHLTDLPTNAYGSFLFTSGFDVVPQRIGNENVKL